MIVLLLLLVAGGSVLAYNSYSARSHQFHPPQRPPARASSPSGTRTIIGGSSVCSVSSNLKASQYLPFIPRHNMYSYQYHGLNPCPSPFRSRCHNPYPSPPFGGCRDFATAGNHDNAASITVSTLPTCFGNVAELSRLDVIAFESSVLEYVVAGHHHPRYDHISTTLRPSGLSRTRHSH